MKNQTVASLVEKVSVFSVREECSVIHKHFETDETSNGVVILNDDMVPVGLIMRNHFYQMIGNQFGFAIYMNRPVDLLMKKDILCLDIDCELSLFGFKAMARERADVFDYVIINKKGNYHGIVSIHNFLNAMSEVKQREIELLKEHQKAIEHAHEKEKSLRQEIELTNKSIKKLLDNADQGFLSFHDNLKIYDEYSRVCDEFFMKPIAGLNFAKLMEDHLKPDRHKLLVGTLESLFKQKKKSRAKTYLSLLPDEMQIDKRFIEISYKPIAFKPQIILMVILTDVTDKKALEKKGREEKNTMALLLSAINSKQEMLDAIKEARQFFSSSVSTIINETPNTHEAINILFRAIHTMKGDFALRSMHNTALQLHTIEDTLSCLLKRSEDEQELNDLKELSDYLAGINIEEILREDLTIIENFLGDGFFAADKSVTINSSRLESLIEAVETRFSGNELTFLVDHIRELTHPSLNSLMAGFREYTKVLALKLGKSICTFNISGDIVYIDRRRYSEFLKSIIHLFRNIVDHGIETPEKRLEKDKAEGGKIECRITRRPENFVLEISDDGQGIDPDKIKKIAAAKGVYPVEEMDNMASHEVINTIFLDSFSTSEEVDMISGRGVGLAAVRNEVENLNGFIDVVSKVDEGTTFRITLPY